VPLAVSDLGGLAIFIAAVVCVVFMFGLPIYAFRRAWPAVREQRERIRRSGQRPQGADFDTFIARWIERMPIGQESKPKSQADEDTTGSREARDG